MKKHLYYLLSLTLFTLSFTACNDDDDEVDGEWIRKNEAAYQAVVEDSEFEAITFPDPGAPTGVYRKVLASGDGTVHPLTTSIVKVHYKGYYYDGTVFDLGTSVSEVPATFAVNGMVRGFTTALQAMVVGDKWIVVIPYYLGYGTNKASSSSSIEGYTTLFFEVELVEIDLIPAS